MQIVDIRHSKNSHESVHSQIDRQIIVKNLSTLLKSGKKGKSDFSKKAIL